jgi:hypothetical protein
MGRQNRSVGLRLLSNLSRSVAMKRHHVRLGILATVCSTIWLAQGAVAETVVIGELTKFVDAADPHQTRRGSGYKVGQRLLDDPKFDIADCVTLVVYTKGKFLGLHGPYQGLLSAYHDSGVQCDGALRETPLERVAVFDNYFNDVCQKQSVCDPTCKAVFQHVTNKAAAKLKC